MLCQQDRDVLAHLLTRGDEAKSEAEKALEKRGQDEAGEMRKILEDQKDRILKELGKSAAYQLSLFGNEEER